VVVGVVAIVVEEVVKMVVVMVVVLGVVAVVVKAVVTVLVVMVVVLGVVAVVVGKHFLQPRRMDRAGTQDSQGRQIWSMLQYPSGPQFRWALHIGVVVVVVEVLVVVIIVVVVDVVVVGTMQTPSASHAKPAEQIGSSEGPRRHSCPAIGSSAAFSPPSEVVYSQRQMRAQPPVIPRQR